MTSSALKQIGSLPSCGGLLSRRAYVEARKRGIEVEILLKQAGLTMREIEDEEAQLPVSGQIKFVGLVADAIGDRNLGFHIAQESDLREIGLLYYVAASADTLGDALRRLERYSFVANEGILLRVKKGKSIRVRFEYAGVARHMDIHQIELWITALVRICRRLVGRDLGPIHARIMHRRAEEEYELAKFLDGRIEQGSDVDEVEFPAAAWHFRVVTADPYLHRMAVRCCEEALARHETSASPLKVRVENAIAALLPHEQAHSDAVAAELGMSSRTMARRLASEGLAFAGILKELRSALARRYLADRSLRISQIAWLLGYSEVGTFTRAFQRWTGKTPSAARARQRRSPNRAIQ